MSLIGRVFVGASYFNESYLNQCLKYPLDLMLDFREPLVDFLR